MKRFGRIEILENLKKKADRGEKIIACTAATGIVGKAAEEAGADLLMCPYTAVFEADGIGCGAEALSYVDANAVAEEAAIKVMSAVKSTPVIAGVGMTDPYRDITYHIKQLVRNKCSGVSNCPSVGMLPQNIRCLADKAGAGVETEERMIKWCRENDIFTAAYIYSEEDAAFLAGADIVIADSGYKEKDEAVECIIKLAVNIRKEKPDAIVLFGGWAFDDMDIVRQCIRKADVQGFVSSRLTSLSPVIDAVRNLTYELEQLETR